MKTSPQQQNAGGFRSIKRATGAIDLKSHKSRKGFALVLVVTSLVLMTIMAVSFLLSTGTDLANVRAYSQTLESKRNADLAVNVALSQLTAATSEGTASAPVAWASQPGMIRTWSADGSPRTFYRLYSSNQPIQAASLFNPNQDSTDLLNWKNGAANRDFNAIWSDLNSPLESGNRRTYPIMPPLLTQDSTAGVDPATISGFNIASPPGYSSGAPSAVNNPAPMPVRWIYVLKDGSLVAGSGSNNLSAGLNGASRSNPPVARIAYWIDDETSKVNINTASEGHYWDYPITNSQAEGAWGQNQPIQNEFQRYPGHPANVSLSAVINNGSISASTSGVYDFSPRVQYGGSQGGTRNTTTLFLSDQIHLNNDLSRLFASTHEMAFRPDPANPARLSNRTQLGIANDSTLAEIAQNREFFLTTHSRAPELNVFDLPRISMWPVSTDSRSTDAITGGVRMDTFDKTVVFSSRLGGRDYFYRRANNFSSTYDYDQIQRNREIYAYLRRLMGSNIPGFGGNFVTKYSADDVNALNTQLFDWIRSGPNIYGLGKAAEDRAKSGGNSLTVNRGYAASDFSPTTNNVFPFGENLGMVVPIRISSNNTKGTGSPFLLTEAGYKLVCERMELDVPSAGRVRYTFRPMIFIETSALKPDVMGAFGRMQNRKENYQLYLRFNGSDLRFTPGANASGPAQDAGFAMGSLIYYARIEPTTVWPVGSQMMTMSQAWWFAGNPNTGGAVLNNVPADFSDKTQTSNALPFAGNLISFDFPKPPTLTDLTVQAQRIFVPPANWTVNVSEMNAEFELGFARSSTDREPIHQGRFIIPAQEVPTPHLAYNGGDAATVYQNVSATRADFSLVRRMDRDPANLLGQGGDIIRTAEISGSTTSPARGDWRLAALNNDSMSADWFAPVTNSVLVAPVKRLFAAQHTGGGYWTNNVSTQTGQNPRLANGIDLNISQWETANPSFVSFNINRSTGVRMNNNRPGDYVTNFPGRTQHDGAIFDYPIENYIGQGSTRNPYFNESVQDTLQTGQGYSFDVLQFTLLYSPNRQIYSPFQMGSLLTQAASLRPWQTLLFTASPAGATGTGNGGANSSDHPGAATPHDHLIADLFWMPRVDPLPISENQSTLGKINLNAAIEPFRSYITRETALHAALKFMKIRAIGNNDVSVRHRRLLDPTGSTSTPTVYDLDVSQTLSSIRARFTSGDVYRTSTEIATVPLFPTGSSGGLRQWWDARRYTGDNLRERPYGYLQALLTTKSNTYRIHWRVQTLTKVPSTSVDVWDEERDQVLAEYRGSTLVERYLDPNDTNIPDYAVDPNARPLNQFYKWRVVSNTQFNP